jgi:hypothetical protein
MLRSIKTHLIKKVSDVASNYSQSSRITIS